MAQTVKNLPAVQEMQETWVQPLDREDSLEKSMANHSSILAWRIPWTEEPENRTSKPLRQIISDQISPALTAVSVCWMAITEYQTEWLINNKNLFLTVLEAGKFKIKALADSVFDESAALLIHGCFLSVSSCGRRGG